MLRRWMLFRVRHLILHIIEHGNSYDTDSGACASRQTILVNCYT